MCPLAAWRRGRHLRKPADRERPWPAMSVTGRQKGLGSFPPIAGRSPTYIVRQLYEFRHGGRTGGSSALMKLPVEKLSQDEMIALAAYVGSLEP